MAATDLETLRELSRLARLSLSEDELARLAPELARVLAAFEALARFEPRAAGEPPAAPGSARSRGDEPLPSLPRDALLAAAPESADGFFVVPKTVGAAGPGTAAPGAAPGAAPRGTVR